MGSTSIKGVVKEGLMGGLAASLISAILVLVFAIICKFLELNDIMLQIINQAIKGVSVFIGVYWMIKTAEKGLYKGLFAGLVFAVVSIVIFCALGGELRFGNIMIDLIIALVNGGLTGVLAVNKKRISRA